jgi:hypothetical protein
MPELMEIALGVDQQPPRCPVCGITVNGNAAIVCSDGTVWRLLSSGWQEIGPSLPGSEAAMLEEEA